MKLIATRRGRTDKYDDLRCLRRDGSATGCAMPRQGILPHDLVHYVVESTLGWRHAFYGMIAAGADIGPAMEQAHDPGNTALADQAIHVEAIVESLQAQLWSGTFDPAMFDEGVRTACTGRGRSVPALPADSGRRMFDAVLALDARWQQVPWYGTLELDLPDL
ncbi:hypothetical protein C5614_06055 [Massilia phosphatilytica]|jgi:hypothetical protein|nr:hypothetical protein C5614_06055 [Massilia phosphatilytica]